MCLIVEKRAADTLRYDSLKQWVSANDDGWGLMYAAKGAVNVVKGIGLKTLWRTVSQHQERAYYLHLRMATHGEVNDGNTHPYIVSHGIWMQHNGIFDIHCADKAKSDTWHFIETVLRPLLDSVPNPHEAIRADWFRTLFESYLGTSNRVVLMDAQGAVTFNDEAWHTFKTGANAGMRVSNTYALGDWTSMAHLWAPLNGPMTTHEKSYLLSASTGGYDSNRYDSNGNAVAIGKPILPDDKLPGWSAVHEDDRDDSAFQCDPWEKECEDNEAELRDDLHLLYGAEYDEIEHFVYSHPERAARVLHDVMATLD